MNDYFPQSALSLKTRKLKALKAEISVKSIEEKSHIVELEELKNDLTKVKNQLLNERKSKEKLLQERQTIMQMQIQCMSAPPHLQTNFTPSLKHPNGI